MQTEALKVLGLLLLPALAVVASAEARAQNLPLLCYFAESNAGPSDTEDITTRFGIERSIRIHPLNLVCEPVHKRHKEKELPPVHPEDLPLACYNIRGAAVNKPAKLRDQFLVDEPEEVMVKKPVYLCDPVRKKLIDGKRQPGTKFPFPTKIYKLDRKDLQNPQPVFTRDEFGVQKVTVETLAFLMVPAVKNAHDEPPQHWPWSCYLLGQSTKLNKQVEFTDQFFEDGQDVKIIDPYILCDPVSEFSPGKPNDEPNR